MSDLITRIYKVEICHDRHVCCQSFIPVRISGRFLDFNAVNKYFIAN